MFKTRDECMRAFARDTEMRRYAAVSIFYLSSTDTYRYSPHTRSESGEHLYAVLEKQDHNNNAWLFREKSLAAREYLENNPLPGDLIIGTLA